MQIILRRYFGGGGIAKAGQALSGIGQAVGGFLTAKQQAEKQRQAQATAINDQAAMDASNQARMNFMRSAGQLGASAMGSTVGTLQGFGSQLPYQETPEVNAGQYISQGLTSAINAFVGGKDKLAEAQAIEQPATAGSPQSPQAPVEPGGTPPADVTPKPEQEPKTDPVAASGNTPPVDPEEAKKKKPAGAGYVDVRQSMRKGAKLIKRFTL